MIDQEAEEDESRVKDEVSSISNEFWDDMPETKIKQFITRDNSSFKRQREDAKTRSPAVIEFKSMMKQDFEDIKDEFTHQKRQVMESNQNHLNQLERETFGRPKTPGVNEQGRGRR